MTNVTIGNTTISIDKATKSKALSRAVKENMNVSTVARILLNDYAEGRISIGARMEDSYSIEEIEVDEETQNEMDKVVLKMREIRK